MLYCQPFKNYLGVPELMEGSVCVCVCVHAWACECVYVCAYVCVCVL